MATKQENVNLLERSKTKPPKLYKVILINDDFTTIEFVIEVLKTFFSMSLERATQVMLQIHNEGSAVCGVYSKEIAETSQGIPVYISMGTPTVGEVDVTKSSWVLTNHPTRFKEYLRGFSHVDRYAIKFDYVTLALDVWRKNDNNEQV